VWPHPVGRAPFIARSSRPVHVKAAVVGHVEWATFARVERVPSTGEIVHASDWWEEPGGGGAGAAMQLSKLAEEAHLFTSLGRDEIGRRSRKALELRGVRVHVAWRETSTRRALTHVEADGERTITVLGERLEPSARDDLPWHLLGEMDAVYFTAGDHGALRYARSARVLVATSRVVASLRGSGVALDALVGSAQDPSEAYVEGDLDPAPGVVVRTEGERGGSVTVRGGESRRYVAVPPPGPVVDRYGAGDSFAAGLAVGLASEKLDEALALAARCGASVVAGRGPYEAQLRLKDETPVDNSGPLT
jgi:ribokinase